MLIPNELAMTNKADARVMVCTDTHPAINCLTETSALPKPMKNLPSIASLNDLYGKAETYSTFPISGNAAEKISADLKVARVYHAEYKRAENIAVKAEAKE
jgi:hypothetical protein